MRENRYFSVSGLKNHLLVNRLHITNSKTVEQRWLTVDACSLTFVGRDYQTFLTQLINFILINFIHATI